MLCVNCYILCELLYGTVSDVNPFRPSCFWSRYFAIAIVTLSKTQNTSIEDKEQISLQVSRYPKSVLKRLRHLKCHRGSLILTLEDLRLEQFELKT